jgi:tRNA/rRNA methyltransferase
MHSMLTACRVILVRTRIAANIGATARVMRNFGLSELVLVAPEADPQDPRGRLLATHAEDLLDKARIVPELGDAVGDCILVVGTSARTGGLFRRQSVVATEQFAPQVVQAFASGPVALVFGPEPSGLTDTEVTRCHYLIHIPTDPHYPALNLAQAVAITLHEIYKAWLNRAGAPPTTDDPASRAPFSAQEQMFDRLREALEAIHFLHGDKADALMHGIRHLLGKAKLTEMEVKLLLGLARQLIWITQLDQTSQIPEHPA